MGTLRQGVLAGAAGTLALQVATYGDMLVRGRGASSMPANAAAKLVGFAGVDIEGDDDASRNRREALGTLMGYATGVVVVATLAAVAPGLLRRPLIGGLAAGAAATAGADGPLVALGLTDPREWPPSSWAADIVPHAVYGIVAASTFAALQRRS